jgi:hypothetical protein
MVGFGRKVAGGAGIDACLVICSFSVEDRLFQRSWSVSVVSRSRNPARKFDGIDEMDMRRSG